MESNPEPAPLRLPHWRAALIWIARVGRIVAAGGLLAWRLGPA
jgi:hypothetical protein